jgi:hypothetical protein
MLLMLSLLFNVSVWCIYMYLLVDFMDGEWLLGVLCLFFAYIVLRFAYVLLSSVKLV